MSFRYLLLLLVLTAHGIEEEVSKDHELTTLEETSEKYEFQAEVASLMDIIINSLYINKEVFLRELISNASDAMDKVRFLALMNPEKDYGDLEIRISYDPAKKTLTISDKGIGMTKTDLVEKLGTVARSGTTQFLEAIAKGGSINLIGQFGVGFYSSFLAADKVTVVSKHDDDDQYIWTSSAGPQFTVKKDPRGNTLGRGTEVILKLKQDAEEFLDKKTIQDTIKSYSEFIDYPIYLYLEKDKYIDVPMTEEEIKEEEVKEAKKLEEKRAALLKEREEKIANGEEVPDEIEEPTLSDEEKKRTKSEKTTEWLWEQVNTKKAIWLNEPKENKIKDYVKLYQTLKKDGSEPLYFTHFHGEGEVDFRAIIFIPDNPPVDMYEEVTKSKSGLRLYVRRVLITEGPEDLIPKYLNFLKGVIHSDDMPLNVSRETLQQQRIFKIMNNKIVKKVLDTLLDLANDKDEWKAERPNEDDWKYTGEDEEVKKDMDQEYQILLRWSLKKGKERYAEFWKNFSKAIKTGVIEDASNRNKLVKLLRFQSTATSGDEKDLTSFAEYVERMPSTQEFIYYLAGEDLEALKKAPHIQKLVKMGYEVILLDDPLDEFAFSYIKDFDEKKVKNLAKGELDLGVMTEYEEKKEQKLKELFKPLTDWWKSQLGREVDKVTLSRRLTTDPVVIVSQESGYTANMYRIAKSQAYSNQQKIPDHYVPRKILEINPAHPAIKKMLELVEDDPSTQQLRDYGWMYYYTGLLASGFALNEDPDFSSRIYRMMSKKMQVSPTEPLAEPDLPEGDDEDEEGTNEEGDVEILDGENDEETAESADNVEEGEAKNLEELNNKEEETTQEPPKAEKTEEKKETNSEEGKKVDL
ncbi:unnamed protein product [Blepharisma stoltei]|uniref:Uncharacterized protein n=1 Tax=Blepharisma stoltei TaxID=1481888 RepID=A0AAU9JS87_9CILI|nr:unnamed protein product [Blepharisma stoltei]